METPLHYFAGVYAVTVLMRHFGKAMHFGANNGVYYKKDDVNAVVVPDVYAVSGKPQTVEDWYFLWEHALPPTSCWKWRPRPPISATRWPSATSTPASG